MTSPSWFEHADLMQILVAALVTVVAWFFIRTLKKIDANQTSLFDKYDNHEQRLSHLEGAHAARVNKLNC